MTWGISVKFSEKTWQMAMLIIRFSLSLPLSLSIKNMFWEKPQGGGSNWPLSPPAILGLSINWCIDIYFMYDTWIQLHHNSYELAIFILWCSSNIEYDFCRISDGIWLCKHLFGIHKLLIGGIFRSFNFQGKPCK